MKQKDALLIGVVIFTSAVFSLLLAKVFITSPKNRQTKVEVVERITTDFKEPDARYFNSNSVNPTQIIRIGDNPNSSPFNQKN